VRRILGGDADLVPSWCQPPAGNRFVFQLVGRAFAGRSGRSGRATALNAAIGRMRPSSRTCFQFVIDNQ
jgi:hypothetical protein